MIEERNIVEVGKRIDKVVSNIGKECWGYRTGFERLDNALLGFHSKELIILAARTSHGKSSLSSQLALKIAEQTKVLYFSLELSSKIIMERMIAQSAELNFYDLRQGKLNNVESKLEKAAEQIKKLNLYIDDAPNLNPFDFEKIIEKEKIGCAIVDYVQLVSYGSYTDNQVREIDMICRSLRNTAKIYDIPVILVAQLNRETEKRKDHRPILSDLRSSGSLEMLSQVVLLLHRPSLYEQQEIDINTEDDETAELIIAKSYNGPTGIVKLRFIPTSMKFVEQSKFE